MIKRIQIEVDSTEENSKIESYLRKWIVENFQKNPEEQIKSKARNIANNKIKIPIGQICEWCKKRLATEKHHEDYSKPLEVMYLCSRCNRHG